MATTITSRRSLLQTLGAAGVAAWAGPDAAGASASGAWTPPVPVGIRRGQRAGDQARVEDTRLRWCPPGRFVMSSPSSEVGRRADEAQVEVTLSRGFWAGAHEVTQGEWTQVMGTFPDRPPTERFGFGDQVPVYWISFDEAMEYCAAVTQRGRASGALSPDWTCTLPTEAQWEYACRAGTTTSSAFGDPLMPSQANFDHVREARPGPPLATPAPDRMPGRAVRVGSYAPNAWGLHDMHGNVWEWCRDWYHATLPGGRDPDLSTARGVANRDGTYSRVRRGGAWVEPEWACRSACRLRYEPHRRSDHIGFRVVLVEA